MKYTINVISNPCKVSGELDKLDCVTVTTSPIESDIYYWLHMGTFHEYAKRNKVGNNHVVLINPSPAFEEICDLVPNAIVQCEYYMGRFKNEFLIEQASDFKPEIKIGIAAVRRPYKGENILSKLFDNYELPNCRFIIAGDRWDRFGSKYPVELLGYVEDMQSFYNNIDYLLIPTDSEHGEGGPIVFIEAMSCCVPVISSRVGYAHSKPSYVFNSVGELYNILNKLSTPMKHNTWDMFREQHLEVFNKIATEVNAYAKV